MLENVLWAIWTAIIHWVVNALLCWMFWGALQEKSMKFPRRPIQFGGCFIDSEHIKSNCSTHSRIWRQPEKGEREKVSCCECRLADKWGQIQFKPFEYCRLSDKLSFRKLSRCIWYEPKQQRQHGRFSQCSKLHAFYLMGKTAVFGLALQFQLCPGHTFCAAPLYPTATVRMQSEFGSTNLFISSCPKNGG